MVAGNWIPDSRAKIISEGFVDRLKIVRKSPGEFFQTPTKLAVSVARWFDSPGDWQTWETPGEFFQSPTRLSIFVALWFDSPGDWQTWESPG
ncbi:MAG: hypothetical protein IH598_09400 [Bacteroidales bacterium]|nr:hypothetical protein [Bacteroidales bacterium]